MGIYAADGSINVTVVDGTTRTGLYAADGSWNVVLSDGVGFAGVYHPCGGYNVTVLTGGPEGIFATDGSLFVQETPYTYSGGLKVTVVSGSLSGFDAPVLTWTSDETVATAVFQIVIPEDVPSGYKVYGEASLSSGGAAFNTKTTIIATGDLIDLQIDDFAFAAFSDGDTVYVRVRLLTDADVEASNWSNIVSKTMSLGSAFTPTYHIYGF